MRRLEAGLRSRHVKTIFDERDFTLEYSLPDAMFEKGIGAATAVVMVLSRASLRSPYVAAEQEAAVMRRIEERVPILLLILDNLSSAEIPMSLRSLIRVYVNADDDTSVESAIAKTANSALGVSFEQELGPPPPWITAPLPALTSEPLDAALLGVAVAAALKGDAESFVARESYFAEAQGFERSKGDAEDSILELRRLGWLEDYNWYGAGRVARQYRATRQGISRWLTGTDPSYEERLRIIGASLVNDGCRSNFEAQRKTGYDLPLINHYFDELEARGLIEIRPVAAGGMRPAKATAALRRFLKQ